WTAAAIAAIGFNLRPAVSGVGPILAEIVHALGTDTIVAGILTTAPVICFGIVGPVTPGLAHRYGIERVILASLVALAFGTAIRALGGLDLLLVGMAVAGLAIGVVNVLLPAVIKQDFPNRIGALTGLYTSALCIGAASSALATPPFERAVHGDWRAGLAIWALPAIVAAAIWVPQLAIRRPTNRRQAALRHELWRNALAWQVTLFITALTSLAYSIFAWGPTLLQDRGMSIDGSAEQLALCFGIQAFSGFFVPLWGARRKSQRGFAVVTAGMSAIGLFGWIFAPLDTASLWSILCGIGQGGAFGLALALIGLRAGSAQSAARLSGMANTICYIAGGLAGPFAVGLVHQVTGGWAGVAALFLVMAGIGMAAGLGAGRPRVVDQA
ncbi:MAG: CynX/NimT family MFS transporter, partial [Stellaceae bacterium]